MATRSASGKILSFVFAAVAVAMVLESSTSVPGSKCLWNNVVSTLVWRVLNQPRGISPDGRGMSRGRGGERIHDRPDVVGRGGPQGIERRRHGGHDRPGASVSQAHQKPGERRRVGFPEGEREQVRRRPAPASHVLAHGEPSAPKRLGEALTQGIAARDEDLVAAQGGGLLVAGRGGAGRDKGVDDKGEADKGVARSGVARTPHGITRRAPTQRSSQYAPSASCGSRRESFTPRVELWMNLSSRSEEHTSELQSPCNLVCRLLLEKKKM